MQPSTWKNSLQKGLSFKGALDKPRATDSTQDVRSQMCLSLPSKVHTEQVLNAKLLQNGYFHF